MVDLNQRNAHPGYGKWLLLLGVLVLFVLSFLPSNIYWIIIKTGIFLLLTILIFKGFAGTPLFSSSVEESPEPPEEEQPLNKLEEEEDVEKSFADFLKNAIALVKNVLVSDTVALLFVNYSAKQFTIREITSSHPELLLKQNHFDIMSGLPSLILRNRTPLIENHLPEGQEIVPYYQAGKSPAKSFIGTPVYFNDLIIGILCADTSAEEAYSNDDLEILKNVANLITVQIHNSNRLYEYETENWVAKILYEMSQGMSRITSTRELWRFLKQEIPRVIPCDRIGIVEREENHSARIVALNGGVGNVKEGKSISLNEGIAGWVIRKNQPLLVDDFSQKENYVPRYFAQETPAREYFSLLCVPISESDTTIGAICLESYRANHFKEQQKRLLQTIANLAASIYTKTQMMDRLARGNYIDSRTGLHNLNAFKWLFPIEYTRALETPEQFFLIFLQLHFEMKNDSREIFENTVTEFLSLSLPLLKDVDYIFRLFPDTFAVITQAQRGDLLKKWIEELLQKVAGKKIWADGNSRDVGLHIGIIPHLFLSADAEEALQKGEKMLEEARQKGFNAFAIYREEIDEERK